MFTAGKAINQGIIRAGKDSPSRRRSLHGLEKPSRDQKIQVTGAVLLGFDWVTNLLYLGLKVVEASDAAPCLSV